MSVIVDTPIWSAAFRHRTSDLSATSQELHRLIAKGQARMLGPIRQETLSGIRDVAVYQRLRELLRAFPDPAILMRDYETAASFFNQCRSNGVQGSPTDYLICAMAVRLKMKIFTVDKDFPLYAAHLPIELHPWQN